MIIPRTEKAGRQMEDDGHEEAKEQEQKEAEEGNRNSVEERVQLSQ